MLANQIVCVVLQLLWPLADEQAPNEQGSVLAQRYFTQSARHDVAIEGSKIPISW